jgi:hypothetical protein
MIVGVDSGGGAIVVGFVPVPVPCFRVKITNQRNKSVV